MGQSITGYVRIGQQNGAQSGEQKFDFDFETEEVSVEIQKPPKGQFITKELARTLVKENMWDSNEIDFGENAAIK